MVRLKKLFDIVPSNDIVGHLDGMECDCHPDVVGQENGDYIVIHHKFSGQDKIDKIIQETGAAYINN